MRDRFDNQNGDPWTTGPSGSESHDRRSEMLGTEPLHRPRTPKKPRGKGPHRALFLIAFVACIVIIVGAVVGGLKLMEGRSGAETTSTSIPATGVATVVVKQGMGTNQVGRLLVEAGLIDSFGDFIDLVKSRGSENSLKPGTYELERGQELVAIVEALEKGAGSNLKMTIPEGMAVGQIAALLDEGGKIDGASYLELSKTPAEFELPPIGGSDPEVTTLEGLLFPSTYFMSEGDTARELIQAQLVAFLDKTSALPWSNAEELGVTPYDIVIIASMIEKEANIAEERAKVASVIYNRLDKEIALGIDATVRFALGKWTGALTQSDLEVDSPYNTRVKKGLPPTPISNPGVAALEAALQPADTDYLYYVLQDEEGHHFFTASYDEFLDAKKNAPQQ